MASRDTITEKIIVGAIGSTLAGIAIYLIVHSPLVQRLLPKLDAPIIKPEPKPEPKPAPWSPFRPFKEEGK